MRERSRATTQLVRLCGALALLLRPVPEANGQPVPAPASRPAPQPHLVVQLGHSEPITSVAFSPDGRRVLTASLDHTAKLWDTETGKQLRSFAGHALTVTSAVFSPDGGRVVTGSDDFGAKIWDADAGNELLSLAGDSMSVTNVAFSPDGRRVLTGNEYDRADLWDAQTGKRLLTLEGHAKAVTGVAFSPDGRRVLTGSADKTARLWDAETGRMLGTFAGHAKAVTSVAFSADGRLVLTGSEDGTAGLWDADTRKRIRSLAGHKKGVTSVALSADARLALTGSDDNTAKLWDASTGKPLRSFAGDLVSIKSVALSADGHRVLTAGDNTAKLWDADTGKRLRSFEGRSNLVTSVAVSPNGRQLLIGSGDNMARLWDASTGKQIRVATGHLTSVSSVAFSPDGRRLLTGSWDQTARLWDADTAEPLRALEGHTHMVTSAAFSPDGRRVVTGSVDRTARLWDAETGKALRTFAGHPQPVTSVAFAPDGRRVLTGCEDGTARLWDAGTGKVLRAFTGQKDPVSSVAFSPDGRQVLTGSWDYTAKLWSTDTGKLLRTFTGHSAFVSSVAFSPDGHRVLTGSWDHTAKLWDADTASPLRTFAGHSSGVNSVAFSPDGRLVFTGGEDDTATLWNAETGSALGTLVSFTDGSWAVVDPTGRFDGSHDGDVEGLHWVVGSTAIELAQLKERYYEPGLLAKMMGFNREVLRPVQRLQAPRLSPVVELVPPAPGTANLRIRVKNRGGGIGKVRVLVNGKEIADDARPARTDPGAAEALLDVSLAGPATKPGQDNRVEVVAWNAEGYLSSRGFEMVWQAPGVKESEPPEVYAIVSGAAHYALSSMNLVFAGKDAADMATALRVSGRRLFGADKVHLTLLTDYPGAAGAAPPTRDNLRKAFEAARRARHDDVLVVYLAGHGAAAADGEYWYLTSEARSTDLSDPQVRALSGVSSAELTEWIKAVPVTKQVLILDTCAAGAAAAKLTEVRALSSDQVRAIARLKDRTGLHVLMGASADAVSYEASQYGQGLLTYALLEGIRGAALRDDAYVDVAKLFGHATDEVPKLARSIGGVQSPIVSAPKGASFDIGQLTAQDKPLIPLSAVRPMILRASFQREEPPFADALDLSRRVNAGLREAADPAARGSGIVFIDAEDLPGALRLSGRYRQVGQGIRVDSYLLEGQTVRAHFEVNGAASDMDALARDVVTRAAAATAKPR